jgi:hypothetical protein
VGKLQRIQPEFGDAIVTRNMDVWRLVAICHVKVKSESFLAKNRWHVVNWVFGIAISSSKQVV